MNLKKLAKDISYYRFKNRLTQGEMAEMIGTSRNTISLLENNKTRFIQDRTIEKLKEVGIKVEE